MAVTEYARRRIKGLYAITPETADTGLLLRMANAALRGGASVIQYRAKTIAPDLATVQGMALAAECRRLDIPFIVNDSVQLAIAVGADGVHIGRDDESVASIRRIMPDAIVGVSCYDDMRLAMRAIDEGADYVAFGSLFPSATKPLAVRADLRLLAEAGRRGMNSVAIGGITMRNASQVIAAGADAIAVISALFENPDADTILCHAQQLSQLFHTCHA
jgi:thiamine-phosphate pyrophosphorylase